MMMMMMMIMANKKAHQLVGLCETPLVPMQLVSKALVTKCLPTEASIRSSPNDPATMVDNSTLEATGVAPRLEKKQ